MKLKFYKAKIDNIETYIWATTQRAALKEFLHIIFKRRGIQKVMFDNIEFCLQNKLFKYIIDKKKIDEVVQESQAKFFKP